MSNSTFKIPNVLIADRDAGSLACSAIRQVRLRCPHCSALGTFHVVTDGVEYRKFMQDGSAEYYHAELRMCPNPECNGLVLTVCQGKDVVHTLPQELLHFDIEGVPQVIAQALREAVVCHSVGAFRAAAMMVRRLLEELCEDALVEGRTLHDRLKALRTKISLPEELFDAMDELKALGNDAAHIEAKTYSSIDKEEAELSIQLAQEIVRARYQHKNLVDRLRARKSVTKP